MKKQKSIKLNFIMNSFLTMSSFIFPLISFPYVSRVLTPVGTGKVSFAISIISYFTIFAQLGIPTYGIRSCAKVRDNKIELSKTVHEIFIINILMTLISYIVFFIAIYNIPKLQDEKLLLIITSSTLFFNTIGMEWLYKALEQYTYITVRSIIFKFIALGAMFLLIHNQADYIKYGAISIFASSASSIFNFIYIRHFIYVKPMLSYNFRRHFKAIFVFFAMSCATTIYTNLDTVMLGFIASNAEVGYYNAAVKIKSILVSIVTSLGVVLLPRASYYIQKGNKKEFMRLTSKAINFVYLISLPLIIYFIIFSKEGIYFLSGENYKNSIIPMKVIMPTVLLIGLTNVMGIQMLIPMGKEKIVLYSEIIGAFINLVVNFILIPKYLSIGAAIGTLIAEMFVWIVQFICLKNLLKEAYAKVEYFKIFISLLCSSFLCMIIKICNFGVFTALLTSSIIFFISYIIFLVMLKENFSCMIIEQCLNRLKIKSHIKNQ